MDNATTFFYPQDIRTLLCQPDVLVELIEACLQQQKPQVIADIVLQDAALTARLLLAAKNNSLTLTGDEPVSSAIQKIGISALLSMALDAAQQLCNISYSDRELLFQYRLWLLSQIGGIFARCLAPTVNFARIEESQLCGVLLNLGNHLLFKKFGERFIDGGGLAISCPDRIMQERELFGRDHLSLADEMISYWSLDSFLADAIGFLNADISHLTHSNILLKIARMSQQFCLSPEDLTSECQLLAEQLLGLSRSESHYLFRWGQDLYPSLYRHIDQIDVLRARLNESLTRLQQLSFLVAGQEAARARISHVSGRDNLLLVSRQLLLEQSPADEVFFFLLDNKRDLLTGMLTGGQHRLVRDLEVPLQSHYSLISDAYLERRQLSSFSAVQALTVTDNLILRLCAGCGFVCFPLHADSQGLGVVVLSLADERDLSLCQSEQLQSFLQIISHALGAEPEFVIPADHGTSGLLYSLSKEVKSPLTIINNYAEVLGRSVQNAENMSLVSAIKKEVKRLDFLLSDYAGAHNDSELFDQGVDLNELVKEVVELQREDATNGVSLSFNLCLQETLDRFQSHAGLIRQILAQLIKNAVEAFVSDGVINIETRLVYVAARDWQVELIVRDNGPGLPVHLQKNLFKPVFSSKGSGHTGVGLHQVKKMVSDLNGQIGCYTSAKCGTCFTIQIPYRNFESE